MVNESWLSSRKNHGFSPLIQADRSIPSQEPGGLVCVEDFCSNDSGVISDQALRPERSLAEVFLKQINRWLVLYLRGDASISFWEELMNLEMWWSNYNHWMNHLPRFLRSCPQALLAPGTSTSGCTLTWSWAPEHGMKGLRLLAFRWCTGRIHVTWPGLGASVAGRIISLSKCLASGEATDSGKCPLYNGRSW